MSKVSANYPDYSSSSISIGNSKASTGVKNGVLTSNYEMSDNESAIYNYALSTLAGILPKLNTFDTDTLSNLKSEVDAYKTSGIDSINDLYNSSLFNIENDVASRFGNLDNSIFKDNLDSLESERSKAVSAFAQDVLAKQNALESDELTQRYALVELLTGLSDGIYNNALKAINSSTGGSSSLNNYNSNVYSALANMAGTSSNYDVTSMLSTLLGSNKDVSQILSLIK